MHPEKKEIGLDLGICEIKGGTGYILRFLLAQNHCPWPWLSFSFPCICPPTVIILCPLCTGLFWTLVDDEMVFHCPSLCPPLKFGPCHTHFLLSVRKVFVQELLLLGHKQDWLLGDDSPMWRQTHSAALGAENLQSCIKFHVGVRTFQMQNTKPTKAKKKIGCFFHLKTHKWEDSLQMWPELGWNLHTASLSARVLGVGPWGPTWSLVPIED